MNRVEEINKEIRNKKVSEMIYKLEQAELLDPAESYLYLEVLEKAITATRCLGGDITRQMLVSILIEYIK